MKSLVLIGLLLVGCTTTRIPVETKVVVSVPCTTKEQLQHLSTDQELATMDDYRLVLMLAKERAEMQALLQGCAD